MAAPPSSQDGKGSSGTQEPNGGTVNSENVVSKAADSKPVKTSKIQKREKNNYFFWFRKEKPEYDGYCYVLNLKEQAELRKLKDPEYSDDLRQAYLRNMFLKINSHFRARYKVCGAPEQTHIRHLGLYKFWQERKYEFFEKAGIFFGGLTWAGLGLIPIGATFSIMRKLKNDRENKIFRTRMRFGFLFSLMGNFIGFQIFYYNLVIVPGFWKHALAQTKIVAGLETDLEPVLLEAFSTRRTKTPTN